MRMNKILATLATLVAGVAGSLVAASPAHASGSTYWYAGAREISATDVYWSISGQATVVNPYTDVANDDHSVMELTVWNDNGNGRNIMEVGWVTNMLANGDYSTKLFVGVWRKGVFAGYNPSGVYVPSCPVTPCTAAGSTLVGSSGTPGTGTSIGNKQFQIQQTNSAWWVAYDGKWIGKVDNTYWSSVGETFTAGKVVDAFGEVASNLASSPCTDMGSGVLATSSAGAYWTVVQFNNANPTSWALHVTEPSPATHYNGVIVAPRSVRIGGPGWC